jgi:hypothetical protein
MLSTAMRLIGAEIQPTTFRGNDDDREENPVRLDAGFGRSGVVRHRRRRLCRRPTGTGGADMTDTLAAVLFGEAAIAILIYLVIRGSKL